MSENPQIKATMRAVGSAELDKQVEAELKKKDPSKEQAKAIINASNNENTSGND